MLEPFGKMLLTITLPYGKKLNMTLHDYLELNGIKPSQLAKLAGVPAATITRVLRGERKPGLLLMEKIMQATNGYVTPNDFLNHSKAYLINDEAAA